MSTTTAISVLVPSRDRPDELRRCVASVLANRTDGFEVIVIDQSDVAVQIDDHPRLRVIRSFTRGKSAALNEGLAVASGRLLAFTDDDCTVPVDWLERVLETFTQNPNVDLMFGNLDAIEHDPTKYFVPIAQMGDFEVVADARRAWVRGGAGACMAARRAMFDVIGGFDERIGPGTSFHACEEFDLYYRALGAGCRVARVPDIAALHWGARSYSDGSGQQLLRWYAYGEGAVVGKHLRLGDVRMLGPGARIMMSDTRHILHSLWRLRLSGLKPLLFKWRGLLAAMTRKIDRERRVFV